MKKCTGPCGELKPLKKFTDHPTGYGKLGKCKDCINAWRRIHRKRNGPSQAIPAEVKSTVRFNRLLDVWIVR